MLRREALRKTALLIGSIAIAPELLARAFANSPNILNVVPPDRLSLLAEMADTIIPKTDTPGAKEAQVQDFIAVVVQDCFSPEQSAAFWRDLEATDERCFRTFGKSFVECTQLQRHELFGILQLEAKEHNSGKDSFWYQLKGLTLQGYFTSEIGATQALNYDPIPGGWIADMPVDASTKAWTPLF